jgi:hypothetical protein
MCLQHIQGQSSQFPLLDIPQVAKDSDFCHELPRSFTQTIEKCPSALAPDTRLLEGTLLFIKTCLQTHDTTLNGFSLTVVISTGHSVLATPKFTQGHRALFQTG